MIKADLAEVVYETHGGISYREAAEIVVSTENMHFFDADTRQAIWA